MNLTKCEILAEPNIVGSAEILLSCPLKIIELNCLISQRLLHCSPTALATRGDAQFAPEVPVPLAHLLVAHSQLLPDLYLVEVCPVLVQLELLDQVAEPCTLHFGPSALRK